MLERALPSQVWQGIQQRRQMAELKKAGITNLAECPFCQFAVIMDNPDDKVLQCLRVGCGMASCRLCRRPSHLPLRCEEVESDGELSARKAMERDITAMRAQLDQIALLLQKNQ